MEKLRHKETHNIVYMEDGNLSDIETFDKPEDWEIYEPKEEEEPMNKIYKVFNPKWDEGYWFDKYDSFVVIVESKDNIRDMILKKYGYENEMPDNWENDPKEWEITYLGNSERDPEIVLASFNAA
jgi:hypothetical protein